MLSFAEKKEMSKVQYTGLFLDASSKIAVIQAVSVHCSLHSRVFAHHLTLLFKPYLEQVKALPIGITVSFQAIGYGADEKAQAVLCTVPDGLSCSNEYPHVTVAVSEGVKPVYSNELLGRKIVYFDEPIWLSGRVGYSDGQNDCFDFVGTIYED